VARFRPRREDKLARELRASRPELSTEFVDSLSDRLESARGRGRRYTRSRLSFAAVLTALLLGALASVGGFGYAASTTEHAVNAVKHALTRSKPTVVRNSAAHSQYARQKVTICHHAGPTKRVTITISEAALPAHLRHGDTIGPC
jgi:hypothetical protein